MSWKVEVEKLLRDQMPYAFSYYQENATEVGKSDVSYHKGQLREESFSEALGYVLDHIENLIEKKAFFDGFIAGAGAAHGDMADIGLLTFDPDISKLGAEKAWLKRNSEC